jgi:hypothetical protein
MPIMERKLTAAKSVERANIQDPPKESTNGTSMTSSHP